MGKSDRTVTCLFGLILGPALVLGALYWTYCWGWWGQNRLLQLLFQCSCPATSEEARYPERIDVLFSACAKPGLIGDVSPSGRYMSIILAKPTRGAYRYDFQMSKLQSDPWPPLTYFLSDELGLHIELNNQADADNYYLYDIRGNRLAQVNWTWWRRDDPIDSAILPLFQSAERVYIVTSGLDVLIVALGQDFIQHPETNYMLATRYSGYEADKLEIIKVLESNNIKSVPPLSREISHNGLFKYRGDIDLVSNNQPVTQDYDGYGFYAQWWVYQDRGVILDVPPVYLIGSCCDVFISPKFFPIPQPILLLKVPKEYLSPDALQAEEARQAQEQAAKRWAMIEFWVVVVIVMAGLTLNFIRNQKKN